LDESVVDPSKNNHLPKKIEEIAANLKETRPDLFEERMPFWDEDKRTITNAIARSAVFSVTERGNREEYKSYKVPAPSNYEITVIAGKSLTEADRDVYLQVMHYFRGLKPNDTVAINIKDFLTSIRRIDGSESRVWLWNALRAMASTTLDIAIKHADGSTIKFIGSLLTLVSKEKDGTEEIRMSLPLDALRLYNEDTHTVLYMNKRLALKGSGSQLAKSLQIKILSHKEPFPMKLETIMSQCGSKISEVRFFKSKLKKALNLLILNKDIDSYTISKDGLVYIKRHDPTNS
jgi:hypothetical protein